VGQLSFWSADARPRALGDLEGLLCGPGRVELFGRGSAARITVVLGPPPVPEEGGDDPGADAVEPEPQETETETDTEPETEPVDPDELAFLDLDPDEIAARLGMRPVLARAGGFPDDGRQRGRHAGIADAVPTGVSGRRGCGDPGAPRQESPVARTPASDPLEDEVTGWRARAVCCALRARGVPAEVGHAEDGRARVRTAFRTDLADLARAWTDGGGMKAVPGGFELDGPRLRLWVLAAGGHHGPGYALGLDPETRTLDDRLLTASRHLGLGARLVNGSLRIAGSRRLRRLGELVGCPPREIAAGVWPV
jgi:hypothetical protein